MRTIIIHNILRVGLITLSTVLSFAANAAGDENNNEHRYIVRIDASMRTMSVEAHFAHPVSHVAARSWQAGRYIRNPRKCNQTTNINVRGRSLQLPQAGLRCLHYEVDFARAAAAERRNQGLSASNVIVSPAAWFWRPPLQGGDSIVVRFEVDDSIAVSVPWRPLNDQTKIYRVPASPESAMAPAAFGQFRYFEKDIPGATLRIVLMQPDGERIDSKHAQQIAAWVRASAANVNQAYGYFPNPSPQVVVLPVSGTRARRDSAVIFGRVIRDGGETVELFVNQQRPMSEFYEHWTATHEFGHLMLPYLSSEHRWISEGFAQYYQNILLARSGRYSEEEAWRKLLEGFERGRNSGPGLSPNQAAKEGMQVALMKIYWSGAAIALLADVELRQRSDGQETLDDVLERLQQCCLPSVRRWSGPEFFAKLDSLIDDPVFMPLYRRYADSAGFPALQPLIEKLGVELNQRTVYLQAHAVLAALRSSITACKADFSMSGCRNGESGTDIY